MENMQYTAVLQKYRSGWKDCAAQWARFGRVHVADLRSDTNNLAERHFRGLKYSDSGGRICARLDDQILLLLNVITKFTLKRQHLLCAAQRSVAARADERLEFSVQELANPAYGHITLLNDVIGGEDVYGVGVCCSCTDLTVLYDFWLADGSCTCLSNVEDVWKHIEAASWFPGHALTVAVIRAAAAEYKRRKDEGRRDFIDINKDDGVFTAVPMAFFAAVKTVPSGHFLHVCTTERTCT